MSDPSSVVGVVSIWACWMYVLCFLLVERRGNKERGWEEKRERERESKGWNTYRLDRVRW